MMIGTEEEMEFSTLEGKRRTNTTEASVVYAGVSSLKQRVRIVVLFALVSCSSGKFRRSLAKAVELVLSCVRSYPQSQAQHLLLWILQALPQAQAVLASKVCSAPTLDPIPCPSQLRSPSPWSRRFITGRVELGTTRIRAERQRG